MVRERAENGWEQVDTASRKGGEWGSCAAEQRQRENCNDNDPPLNAVFPLQKQSHSRVLPRDRGGGQRSSWLARLNGQVINFSYDFDHDQLQPELAGNRVDETGDERDELEPSIHEHLQQHDLLLWNERQKTGAQCLRRESDQRYTLAIRMPKAPDNSQQPDVARGARQATTQTGFSGIREFLARWLECSDSTSVCQS